MSPPSTARATPTMSVNGWIGAVRWMVDDVVTAWVDWPKRPARLEPWNVDTPTVLADSAGEKAVTAALAPKPRAMPSAPATRPMPTVSATIWRTTRPRDHPIARRVPISRTRLPTEESVSSMAMTNAAATKTNRPRHDDDPERPAEGVRQLLHVLEGARDLVGERLRGDDRRAGQLGLD